MSDGPFKNIKLGKRLKRFVEAVQCGALDSGIRTALASDAILHGLVRENQSLIRKLQSHAQDAQQDLDHGALIKMVFDAHPKSEFADHLQREVNLRLYEGEGSADAVNNGLLAALETGIHEFRTRVHEATLEAQKNGAMRKAQLENFINESDQVLQNINRSRLLKALKECDGSAFQSDLKKKEGLDDGPKLSVL